MSAAGVLHSFISFFFFSLSVGCPVIWNVARKFHYSQKSIIWYSIKCNRTKTPLWLQYEKLIEMPIGRIQSTETNKCTTRVKRNELHISLCVWMNLLSKSAPNRIEMRKRWTRKIETNRNNNAKKMVLHRCNARKTATTTLTNAAQRESTQRRCTVSLHTHTHTDNTDTHMPIISQ